MPIYSVSNRGTTLDSIWSSTVRRSPAVIVTLALMASALIAGSPASAVPYEGTVTGVLSARPSTFIVDQEIELLANFPSGQTSKVNEFF